MLPESVQNWIRERLDEVNVKFPGGEIKFRGKNDIRNREDAIVTFVALSLKVKEAAYNLDQDTGTELFGNRLTSFTEFIQIHHPLLPDGNWKVEIPNAVNKIVETRNHHASCAPPNEALEKMKANVEFLLNSIDHALTEISNK